MPPIPADHRLDCSLALLADPSRFIANYFARMPALPMSRFVLRDIALG